MFSYQICEVPFQSNILIHELPKSQQGHPAFTFQLYAENRRHSKSYDWLNAWYAYDGRVWLAFARIETGYLLRFPAFADFVISKDARTISGFPRGNTPEASIRHLLLNQIIPIVLSQQGNLVLHASACLTPQGVLAFMGTTGMGKSTLAASFGLRGFPVLTDDCLLVEEREGQVISVLSYAGVRLWPESVEALFDEQPELQPLAHYTDKKRFVFDQRPGADPLPLRAVYVLTKPDEDQPSDEIRVLPLSSSEALLEAVKHTFQLDVTDLDRLGQAFRRYQWLAQSVPFFRLIYPRDHAALPVVNSTILNHAAQIQDRELIPT